MIGLEINLTKTSCIRIGPRHDCDAVPITIEQKPLKWVKEIKYLGLRLVSAKKFTVNLQESRQNYIRALNGVIGKVGTESSPLVLSSLIESFCVPVLTYGAESIVWSKSMLNSCEQAYSQAYFKMFKTYDKAIIKQCQYYIGQLPIEYKIMCRKLHFINQLKNSMNSICMSLVKNNSEILCICSNYNIPANHCYNVKYYKTLLWQTFERELSVIS